MKGPYLAIGPREGLWLSAKLALEQVGGQFAIKLPTKLPECRPHMDVIRCGSKLQLDDFAVDKRFLETERCRQLPENLVVRDMDAHVWELVCGEPFEQASEERVETMLDSRAFLEDRPFFKSWVLCIRTVHVSRRREGLPDSVALFDVIEIHATNGELLLNFMRMTKPCGDDIRGAERSR